MLRAFTAIIAVSHAIVDPAVPDDTIEMIFRVKASPGKEGWVQDMIQQIHDITVANAESHGVRYFGQASSAFETGLFATREGYMSAVGVKQHLVDVAFQLDVIRANADDLELFFTAPASETEALQSLGYDVWTLADYSIHRPNAIASLSAKFVGVGALYVITDRNDFDEVFGGIAQTSENEEDTLQFGIAFKENATGTYAYLREGYTDPAADHTHYLAIKPLIDSGEFNRGWSVSPFSRIYAMEEQMVEELTVRSPTEGICTIKTEGCDFFAVKDDIYSKPLGAGKSEGKEVQV